MLFVLGEPHKLVLADINKVDDQGVVLDTNPGPSLFSIPSTELFSYTKQEDDTDTWKLKVQSFATQSFAIDSIQLPSNSYYYAWSHLGHLMTSEDGALVAVQLSENERKFHKVAGACETAVSRIAVSQKGRVALVCSNE
jgi:hypothetical protein